MAFANAMETDLYLTLGIDDDASPLEITHAWGKLEQLMHGSEDLKQDDDAIREVLSTSHSARR